MTFQTKAASAPPARGATMNTQMSLNALPPSNSAGPMLQLRLTAAAQPRNVSVNVPTSSAKYFFMSVIFL